MAFLPKQISWGDGIFSRCSSGCKGMMSHFSMFWGTRYGGVEIYFFISGNLILNPIFFFRKSENRAFHLHFMCCLFNHISFCLVSSCPSLWFCKPSLLHLLVFEILGFLGFKSIEIYEYVACLQSVTKTMGKTAISVTFCFYPLPPLNNVEKQWAKVASSYVTGLQHCIVGEGEFYTKFWKFP